MTFYAGAEGARPEPFDTEAEALAHAQVLAMGGKKAVVFEVEEDV